MAYAITLNFDPEAEATIYAIWQDLAAAGFDSFQLDSGVRPHVSLAISDTIDQNALATATATFAASRAPFRLTLAHIGHFPTAEGVLFLGVAPTPALLGLHADYTRLFALHARQPYAYYRPGTWVPHCTLTMGLQPEEASGALAAVWRAPLPIYASVHEMSLVDSSLTQVTTLNVFQLGQGA